ncbi:MAG: hypothetical protein ACTSYB_07260 [Candidatus Helarchaeota archaeon]
MKATKSYGDIVNLLESLEGKIETEIEKFQEECSKKYTLDITREIIQYAIDYLKMKINLIMNDIIKDFNWYTVVIDATEIHLNMYEIEALLRQVKRKIQDNIPKDPDIEDLQIILKKYLRKVICRIPTKWTEPVALQFLQQFETMLNQLGIIVD